ncbi:MAG: Ribosomal RNA small subunit methyltransferase A [Alphaproteobacteria bacterium ADurb.BinA280]|nr:MAG: Ribosomal RNA small subunit methyltransferase A [Alphaproteobacteria bacterium ADurb.BinA280]
MSHQTKKSLGQHFLHSTGIIDKILLAIAPMLGDRLVEIGPGAGAITAPLLAKHGQLTVIEFDRDLIQPLRELGGRLGDLQIIHADVLNVDLCALASDQPIRLIGNLPYNISTPILFHALSHLKCIRDMHFMLQKEVVDRMAAGPGSKVYGRLSVMLQARCRVEPLFIVPPGAFQPPPKVDSAVVRLLPRAPHECVIDDSRSFSQIVRAAFAQRRKTLRNALSDVCNEADLRAVDIDPGARAETVAVARYIALANRLHAEGKALSLDTLAQDDQHERGGGTT